MHSITKKNGLRLVKRFAENTLKEGRISFGRLLCRLSKSYSEQQARELEHLYGFYWALLELEMWFPLDQYTRQQYVER